MRNQCANIREHCEMKAEIRMTFYKDFQQTTRGQRKSAKHPGPHSTQKETTVATRLDPSLLASRIWRKHIFCHLSHSIWDFNLRKAVSSIVGTQNVCNFNTVLFSVFMFKKDFGRRKTFHDGRNY